MAFLPFPHEFALGVPVHSTTSKAFAYRRARRLYYLLSCTGARKDHKEYKERLMQDIDVSMMKLICSSHSTIASIDQRSITTTRMTRLPDIEGKQKFGVSRRLSLHSPVKSSLLRDLSDGTGIQPQHTIHACSGRYPWHGRSLCIVQRF